VITSVGDETIGTDSIDDATPASDGDQTANTADDDRGQHSQDAHPRRGGRRMRWSGIAALGVLPGLALVLTGGAGYLKWQYDSAREAAMAQKQSVAAATDSTIALLSYRSDTVETQLTSARDRLTGTFRDSYSSLIHDVVIPGAQQKHISAAATVPAAATVSATANHAVVLLFVDQSITAGTDAPTSTASSVKVTLDKVGDRWLISDFTPV
jgi:Mce-associated membrane protein